MNTNIKSLLALAAMLSAFAIAGQGDYEAAVMQEKLYCENVANGVWPNYNPDIDCPVTEDK